MPLGFKIGACIRFSDFFLQSLSAAHLLTASSVDHLDPRKQSTSNQLSANSDRLPQPPPTVETLYLQPFPSRGDTDKSKSDNDDSFSSPELAINAATVRVAAASGYINIILFLHGVQLLDVCRRLDAAEQSSHKEPMEEAECATLRVLLNVRRISHTLVEFAHV